MAHAIKAWFPTHNAMEDGGIVKKLGLMGGTQVTRGVPLMGIVGPILFLCFSLPTFSPAVMFCLATGPKVLELTDHWLKPPKL
jgi:hypothetical protein